MEHIGNLENPLKLVYFSCRNSVTDIINSTSCENNDLKYFRGTCDVIRLVLVDQEIPYEEHNVSGKDYLQPEFQSVLLESGNFPMLPFLSDPNNQVEITGSFTILRYIGEKCNLMGRSGEDRIKIENWIEFLQSLLHSIWDFDNSTENFSYNNNKRCDKLGYGLIGTNQQNKRKSQFILETLHPMLKNLDDKIETDLWVLSCGYTIIDILLYSTISVIIKSLGLEILGLYKK
ncbi:hypothetical protein FG386_001478 [Cryptosporidium ryanae]|uniref:uncharacterized protein n=1 Tax=Cryptosporidium ryanae TaxID=515981 RepID=UPI003519FE2C|nr:hypothetical protein FG386_001478 [Cryptosporidium ryanae]